MPPLMRGHRTLFPVFRGNEVQRQGFYIGLQLGVAHAGGIQHPLGGQVAHGVGVLVGQVDHFLHAALNDGLGALVAGEQRHIDPAAPQVTAVGVQDGVQLRVDHIGILGHRAFPLPGKFVIGAALGHAVVAGGDDDIVLGHDAGAHLRAGVLAAHGCQHGNAHKIFVPADIIGALHSEFSLFCISIRVQYNDEKCKGKIKGSLV